MTYHTAHSLLHLHFFGQSCHTIFLQYLCLNIVLLFLLVKRNEALTWQPHKYWVCWISLSSLLPQHTYDNLVIKFFCQRFTKPQKCSAILLIEQPFSVLHSKKQEAKVPIHNKTHANIFNSPWPKWGKGKILFPFIYFNMKTKYLYIWAQQVHTPNSSWNKMIYTAHLGGWI